MEKKAPLVDAHINENDDGLTVTFYLNDKPFPYQKSYRLSTSINKQGCIEEITIFDIRNLIRDAFSKGLAESTKKQESKDA